MSVLDYTILLPLLGAITAFLKFMTPVVGCLYLLLRRRSLKLSTYRNRRN